VLSIEFNYEAFYLLVHYSISMLALNFNSNRCAWKTSKWTTTIAERYTYAKPDRTRTRNTLRKTKVDFTGPHWTTHIPRYIYKTHIYIQEYKKRLQNLYLTKFYLQHETREFGEEQPIDVYDN